VLHDSFFEQPILMGAEIHQDAMSYRVRPEPRRQWETIKRCAWMRAASVFCYD
jgi:hypothetical protein